ncbi:hypothetical protein MKW98_018301 [Papaver atlanticum]|uniref:PHD-type domain-containing protein n=1 Tax=Papaver atlanticum TaxID=357466 RepID=A0AAD4T5L1_9MAGN|nr:hypothetical protein MKW98_018301 [Papaver atlanticum]
MAKGRDTEEFKVLSSNPRTGLKREFAFAMNAQSECSGSLGRTRARKAEEPNSVVDLGKSSKKRAKLCVPKEEQKEIVSDNEETLISKEGEIENGNLHGNIENGDEQKNARLKELVKTDLLKLKQEINSDGLNGETQVVVEKTPRRFTRSALKATEIISYKKRNASLGKTKTRFTRSSLDSMTVETVMDGNKELGKDSAEAPEKEAPKISRLAPANLVENTPESGIENTVTGTSDKLLTCLSLDQKADEMVTDDNMEVEITSAGKPSLDSMEHLAVIPENSDPQLLSLDKPGNCFPDSGLETKADDLTMDDNKEVEESNLEPKEVQNSTVEESTVEPKDVENSTVKQSNLEPKEQLVAVTENPVKQNVSASISTKRFPRVALEVNKDLVMSPISNQLNVSSEKPMRRFTRSLVEPKAEPAGNNGTYEQQNVTPEKSMQRFTRSLLEPKLEHEVIDCSNEVHNGVSEEAPRRFTRSVLKPKEERTDTSEYVFTNSPSNVKELFETGMLEGLVVKYAFPGKKTTELGGTIKELGILCSCILCKGEKVVTPCQFEQHAGGTKEHPEEYIYLENGSSLKEVLGLLKDIPLEKLKATIQSAISTAHVKTMSTCMYCKGPLSGPKRVVQVCNKCLEARRCSASPARKTGDERSKSVVSPKSLKSIQRHSSSQKKSSVKGKITRKDLGLHKLVFEEGGLPDGTELAYYMNGKKLLEGYKKGFSIFCRCCNSEVSPSAFEAHAGWASRRKPYLNIYTSNGVSLHELSISLSKSRKFVSNYNDDLCGICADFGDLLLCDGCPRAFHRDCVGELRVPRGDWYCPYCVSMFQRENHCTSNANARAAGRVEGVDVIEQITKRCIRIAETTEPEVGGGCSLCRSTGFSKSEFGPRTVIICDQCQKEYHVGCLKDHKMADLQELPKGDWFCCTDCNRIHTALQKLIVRGSERLPDSLLAVVKEKLEEKGLNIDGDLDVRWRLLSGKTTSPDSRSLLSKALAIFHDRFDPIVDATTGRDLIPAMIYGRNNKVQDYGGMYCAVLTINSSVVTAGILRIFGQEVAELPLVATSSDHQGQGYFQSLFCCLERLLGFLKVKNLVLPSAGEAESIWTDRFGFEKVGDDKLKEYKKDYQMAIFQGTSVLQKAVPKCRIIDRSPKKS